MKIITGTNGNYAPSYVKTAVNADRTTAAKRTETNISSDEKKYFADLYPLQKKEVMDYQFYNAKGKTSGIHIGSIIDRRG